MYFRAAVSGSASPPGGPGRRGPHARGAPGPPRGGRGLSGPADGGKVGRKAPWRRFHRCSSLFTVCVVHWFEQAFTGFHRCLFSPSDFSPPFRRLAQPAPTGARTPAWRSLFVFARRFVHRVSLPLLRSTPVLLRKAAASRCTPEPVRLWGCPVYGAVAGSCIVDHQRKCSVASGCIVLGRLRLQRCVAGNRVVSLQRKTYFRAVWIATTWIVPLGAERLRIGSGLLTFDASKFRANI